MKRYSIASFGYSMACLALLALTGQANAELSKFSGRGVFQFASASGCAEAVTGSVDRDCNRIALDVEDAHASVDPLSHTIVIGADAVHDDKTVIGDVLLHGSGVSTDGQRVPLSLHVLLRRSDKLWKSEIVVHSPVRDKFSDIVLDPYKISVREGASERVILTPEEARNALAQPSVAARMASHLVVVRPSDEQDPSANDITVALGIGRLSKSLMRAKFTSVQPETVELNQLLAEGTWNLNLQALSGQVSISAIQRQLFVFGLEDSPLLKNVHQRGLNALDTLELGAINGKGYLRFNGREEAFPAASTCALAFMRDSFIGLILAWNRSSQAARASAVSDAAVQIVQ
jgi:hypothetical protein